MKHSPIISLFAAVMLIFVLFTVWYLPTAARQRATLTDLDLSLETSFGRERKQQAEYDEVVAELPEVRARLEALLPESEAAEQAKEELKMRKKELKAEKKQLENDAVQTDAIPEGTEEIGHE